jgi:hypothetical protein
MKPSTYKLFAAVALVIPGLMLSGCQQAPTPAASTETPAPATTVIENVHHDDRDAGKMQDRDHARPDAAPRRDNPDDAARDRH